MGDTRTFVGVDCIVWAILKRAYVNNMMRTEPVAYLSAERAVRVNTDTPTEVS